jgi:hypothetical protein
MAEAQPSSIVEGATTGDVDDEVPVAAKSAEDRKVAGALSKLDAREDESTGANGADQEAMKKALAGISANGSASKEDDKKVVKKNVKVDPADVALLVCYFWLVFLTQLLDLEVYTPFLDFYLTEWLLPLRTPLYPWSWPIVVAAAAFRFCIPSNLSSYKLGNPADFNSPTDRRTRINEAKSYGSSQGS